MRETVTVPNDFDDKFIQISLESCRLHDCLSVLTSKIDEIESPDYLTLDELNRISALAKVIEGYANHHSNSVNNMYTLVRCRKD